MPEPEKRQEDVVDKVVEEIEVSGGELVARIKELIREGNIRRLIIRNPKDEIVLEIPLAAGLALGGVVAYFSLPLVAIGAVAAVFARLKIQIVREGEGGGTVADDGPTSGRKKRIQITAEDE